MLLNGFGTDLWYVKQGSAWWVPNAGYSDFEIGKNKYKVMYAGAADNEPSTVVKFAYQRAKELCKEKGFNDFVASNANSASNTHGFNGFTSTKTSYSIDVECKNS
jgi:hypothetical protein